LSFRRSPFLLPEKKGTKETGPRDFRVGSALNFQGVNLNSLRSNIN